MMGKRKTTRPAKTPRQLVSRIGGHQVIIALSESYHSLSKNLVLLGYYIGNSLPLSLNSANQSEENDENDPNNLNNNRLGEFSHSTATIDPKKMPSVLGNAAFLFACVDVGLASACSWLVGAFRDGELGLLNYCKAA